MDRQPHSRFANRRRGKDRPKIGKSPFRDSADTQNMLHITRPHTTPTASLIETTRGLAFRSQAVQYAMLPSKAVKTRS